MAFCPNCGAETTGRFCGNCGAAVESGSSTPAPESSLGSQGGRRAEQEPIQSGLADHEAGALCYIPGAGFLLSIVFLVLAPYNTNRNVRFHAFQGLFLGVAVFAGSIVVAILAILPILGPLLAVMFWVLTIIGFLFLAWQTYQQQRIVVPVIGPLAEEQAGR